ncbi:hypothetical protein [Synechococcus sp. MU1648]|uniref:hypothetical protein n=1 Tax=Synechococcus sp. MU1648 TaxID=2508351 RepID=UPI0020262E59|nr:hypothetical protein [Synechococcus sp. MU1648]
MASLIGITVTSLVVFLLERYGSFRTCWRNLLAWLDLLGLLSLSLSSVLHDLSVRQVMDAEFGSFKAGSLKRVAIAQSSRRFWSKVRFMYSNISVVDIKARLDLVLNVSEDYLAQSLMNYVYQNMLNRVKPFGLGDLNFNISVMLDFNNQGIDL